ncbi:hypothetical protein [Marinicella meishanensis]|uniref:hypothetical protein n=1 Tax=Marinicella meishanensis TaxID=2873263 RepID=UPI001CC12130|nr:hypothetical protein [Marinicella sp. NBU2979]
MQQLIRHSGLALILAGLFLVISSVVFTPFVDFQAAYADTLTSAAFMYRMAFATLSVACLLFGSVGLFLQHDGIVRARRWRTAAFFWVFFGTACMFANEFHHLFVLPDLAGIIPQAMNQYDASDHFGRFLASGLLAILGFGVGWLVYMLALLFSGYLQKTGPLWVISGMLLVPLLSGLLSPMWGGAIGSLAMGVGFCWLGGELLKAD